MQVHSLLALLVRNLFALLALLALLTRGAEDTHNKPKKSDYSDAGVETKLRIVKPDGINTGIPVTGISVSSSPPQAAKESSLRWQPQVPPQVSPQLAPSPEQPQVATRSSVNRVEVKWDDDWWPATVSLVRDDVANHRTLIKVALSFQCMRP
jgi:hypothetical protein